METLKVIEIRKSTRSYKSEQIKDELLNAVIHAGVLAPVGAGEYDKLHLTIIQNRKILEKYSNKAFELMNMKPFYGAPTVIIVSGTKRRAPNIEYMDAACIIENMHLAATDLGLGSVYLYGFLNIFNSDTRLLNELGLPEGYYPLSGIALGYPTEPLAKRADNRKTISINKIL